MSRLTEELAIHERVLRDSTRFIVMTPRRRARILEAAEQMAWARARERQEAIQQTNEMMAEMRAFSAAPPVPGDPR